MVSGKELRVLIIQELLSKDLDDKTFRVEFKSKRTDVKAFIPRDLFAALANLYDYNIVYNDIKPVNTILTKDNKIKIIDFGMAGHLNDPTFHGTNCFDFPKSKDKNSKKYYNHKAYDIYAMIVSSAVIRTSFNTVCDGYFKKNCENNYWNKNCFK